MLTVILKVLTTLPELAAECLVLLGEGARPDATQEETFFALCNTPVQNGYIRIIVAEHIATALQWMQDNGVTSEHAEIIAVEWFGQDVVRDYNEVTGEETFAEELFIVATGEEGNAVYLGRIGA